jgi:hypothetical protein
MHCHDFIRRQYQIKPCWEQLDASARGTHEPSWVRLGAEDIRSARPAVLMTSLSLLLFQNGLPDLPVVLIEPHRNRGGIWRIKFCYDADQPLSMSAEQASSLATDLYQLGEDELAGEIDDAVRSATRYGSM